MLGVNNLQRLPYGERRTPRAPEDVEKDLQKSAQDVATASSDTVHALVEAITRNLMAIGNTDIIDMIVNIRVGKP